MQGHIKILGILHIVFGSLGAVVALCILLLFGGIATVAGMVSASGNADAAVAVPIIGVVGTVIAVIVLCLAIPGIVVGWGLLNYKPWARILGIVVSALQLFSVPVGTAIGIYGLWVLLNNETEALFRASAPPR